MAEGHELIKAQLFFRKELMERVQWFIRLRWTAAAAGLVAVWIAYILGFPIAVTPVTALLLFCALYNTGFSFLLRTLQSSGTSDVRHYVVFAHAQFALDFLALFGIIFFTGGLFSPVLIFIFFHIMLTGILLEPLSCYIYSAVVLLAAGLMIFLQVTRVLPPGPPLLEHPFLHAQIRFADMAAAYGIFAAAVVVTAYLITTLKISLRTKGRELLSVSRQLDLSNAKLMALYGMVKEMHMCSDLQALADSAARNAAIIMGVKACSIKLLDEQRRNLRFVSTYGLSEDYVSKGPIDIEKSLVNLRVVRGDKISIGRVDETYAFQYPEDIVKENISSLICLPLRAEKMITGVFCIYSGEADFFTQQDVDFFSLMADLTALGIENIKTQENKTWFLRKAAHQLRSPLNATHSMLDTLLRQYQGPLNSSQKGVLERCMTRISLLAEMVGDLLKIGIKRADIRRPDSTVVDVQKKLKEVAGLYQPRAYEKNIGFNLQIDDAVPGVKADPQLFDNLFSNLISNAVKYTNPGGRVDIALGVENESHILFEVSDTGIGIPEQDLTNIFTEFYRSENARAYTEKGTGLGLVIVKEVMDALGGTVTVESPAGKGARFFCRFPAAQ
ncbi:MAG: GAF domain-containing protein [Desulfobacteraceae bacterium]|nr:GAF domain-containing protein [Desulfobacteraceae bacterium]